MTVTRKNGTFIPSVMIAPCGINCGRCSAHLRAKNKCAGCNVDQAWKPKHCLTCKIKTCDQKPEFISFCFECKKFPCTRLRRLDNRYLTKYGLGLLDNLEKINKLGLKHFMKIENTRWVCQACGGPICIHDKKCYSCGKQYPYLNQGTNIIQAESYKFIKP